MGKDYSGIVNKALYTACRGLMPFALKALEEYDKDWWDRCIVPVVKTGQGKDILTKAGSPKERFSNFADPYLLLKVMKIDSADRQRVPNREIFKGELGELGILYVEELYIVRNGKASPIRSELGIIIVAVKKPSAKMAFNPSPDTLIEAGDLLITLGHRQQLDRLEEMAGGK